MHECVYRHVLFSLIICVRPGYAVTEGIPVYLPNDIASMPRVELTDAPPEAGTAVEYVHKVQTINIISNAICVILNITFSGRKTKKWLPMKIFSKSLNSYFMLKFELIKIGYA